MISIAGRTVGAGQRCLIVAEVAQAHDGSLGFAHAFIDSVAETGADAIKFQTHIAEAESTLDEPWRVKFSEQDETRYDYWRRMEFTAEQWCSLRDHALARNLIFLSSAFSLPAVDLLQRLGMPAWKIGSGDFATTELLSAMAATGKPILYSTGMATWHDIDKAVARFNELKVPFALFQCTSKYPAPVAEVGLNVIDEMRRRYGCPAGLSDHTGVIEPSLAAVARGADLLEVHVTFDRGMFGPDVRASLTFAELQRIVTLRNACWTMDASPVDKGVVDAHGNAMRSIFSRSLAPKYHLRAGTTLTIEMLAAKKPGTGISPDEIGAIVGRRLICDVPPDRLLRHEDLEDLPDKCHRANEE